LWLPTSFSFGLSPSILIPGLHLSVVQSQLVRHLHAILHAQVLLPFERFLQRLQLIVGERRPRFPLLFAQPMCAVQLQAAVHAISVLIFAACQKSTEKKRRTLVFCSRAGVYGGKKYNYVVDDYSKHGDSAKFTTQNILKFS
jgi:hypothetical protein